MLLYSKIHFCISLCFMFPFMVHCILDQIMNNKMVILYILNSWCKIQPSTGGRDHVKMQYSQTGIFMKRIQTHTCTVLSMKYVLWKSDSWWMKIIHDTLVAKYYTLNYSFLVHVHHVIFEKEYKILGTWFAPEKTCSLLEYWMMDKAQIMGNS